ncbi:hypothetical protein [Alteromonas flava]|uniref:hypothetical protein n=1 Tax=Alteromonas flava TaxID=2048003 RepID=UPI000F5FC213|nr:hypothetical protein [Alteromonas flava]
MKSKIKTLAKTGLPNYVLVSSKGFEPSGSLVYCCKGKIRKFIIFCIDGSKRDCWLECAWADSDLISRNIKTSLSSLTLNEINLGATPREFSESNQIVDVTSLQKGPNGYVFKPYELPMALNARHISRNEKKFEDLANLMMKDATELAYVYLNLLEKHQKGHDFLG